MRGGWEGMIRLSNLVPRRCRDSEGYLCQAFLLLYCNPSEFQIPSLLCLAGRLR